MLRRNHENARLNSEITELKNELDDLKSQLVIAGMTLENSFEQEKRKANEEIASLQQLIHGIFTFVLSFSVYFYFKKLLKRVVQLEIYTILN